MQDLTVSFEEKKLKKEMDKMAEELRKEVSIPGFRKGRVPINILKERFGPQLKAESLQRLIQDKMFDIINEYEPFIYGPPVIKKLDESDKEVRLEILLDIPPKINLDFSAMEIKEVNGGEIDISSELEKLREINSELKSVERKVKKGDIVFLDIKNEEEVISNYSWEIGDDEFSQNLIGLAVEKEKKYVKIDLPENISLKGFSYDSKSLNVRIVEIKEKKKPSLDNEFAKDLGFGSLKELKENLKKNIEEERKKSEKDSLKNKVVRKALELAGEFEVSPSLVKIITASGFNETEANVEARTTLLLDSIALKEKMTVEDEELDEWMEKIANSEEDEFEEFGDEAIRFVKQSILREKSLDFLLDKAKGEESNA